MRNIIKTFLVATLVALAGCASQQMKTYVGKDIQDVMVDYGKPDNEFNMPDGRRAFQWTKESTSESPRFVDTTETTQEHRRHDDKYVESTTIIHGGETSHTKCVYTMFGTWDAARDTWVIVDFKKPSFACE